MALYSPIRPIFSFTLFANFWLGGFDMITKFPTALKSYLNGRKFDDDLDKSALQARNILLQNERLELANAEKRKLLIPRDLAKQVFTQLIFAAKSRCFTGIPRFVTLARMAKDTVDASEEMRKEFNDIWEQMTDGKWFDEKSITQDEGDHPSAELPPT